MSWHKHGGHAHGVERAHAAMWSVPSGGHHACNARGQEISLDRRRVSFAREGNRDPPYGLSWKADAEADAREAGTGPMY